MKQAAQRSLVVGYAFAKRVFGKFLADEEITEIAINKPKEIWTEKHGVWTQHFNEALFSNT